MSTLKEKKSCLLDAVVKEYYKTGGAEQKEAIARAAEPLVNYYAALYSPGRIDEDLKQAGYEGLMKALVRFDPAKGTAFSTYASHCMIGEIRHELRDRGPFKIPEWMRVLQKKIIDATEDLAQERSTLPSLREIAERVNVSEAGIVEAMQVGCISIDEVDLSKVKHLRYESFKLPIEDKLAVQMSLEKMEELQKQVIRLIYYEGFTQ